MRQTSALSDRDIDLLYRRIGVDQNVSAMPTKPKAVSQQLSDSDIDALYAQTNAGQSAPSATVAEDDSGFNTEAMMRGMMESLTFGYDQPLQQWYGAEGQTEAEREQYVKQRKAELSDKHFWSNLAGSAIGTLAPAVILPLLLASSPVAAAAGSSYLALRAIPHLLRGASFLYGNIAKPTVKQLLASGAAGGALYGSSKGKDLSDRVLNAMGGGVVGGIENAVLGKTLGAIGGAIPPLWTKLTTSVPEGTPKAAISTYAKDAADWNISGQPGSLAEAMTEKMGEGGVLMGLPNKAMDAMSRRGAHSPEIFEMFKKARDEVIRKEGADIFSAINTNLSHKVDDLFRDLSPSQFKEHLSNIRQDESVAIYNKLGNRQITDTKAREQLDKLLDKEPLAAQAFREAYISARKNHALDNTGMAYDSITEEAIQNAWNKGNNIPEGMRVTEAMLHHVQDSLDDLAHATLKEVQTHGAKRKSQHNVYKKTRQQLLEIMDTINPQYPHAREIYHQVKSADRWMQRGRDVISKDTADILEDFGKLSDMDNMNRAAFQMGVRSALEDMAGMSRAPAKSVLNYLSTPYGERVITEAFGETAARGLRKQVEQAVARRTAIPDLKEFQGKGYPATFNVEAALHEPSSAPGRGVTGVWKWTANQKEADIDLAKLGLSKADDPVIPVIEKYIKAIHTGRLTKDQIAQYNSYLSRILTQMMINSQTRPPSPSPIYDLYYEQ